MYVCERVYGFMCACFVWLHLKLTIKINGKEKRVFLDNKKTSLPLPPLIFLFVCEHLLTRRSVVIDPRVPASFTSTYLPLCL